MMEKKKRLRQRMGEKKETLGKEKVWRKIKVLKKQNGDGVKDE